MIFNNWTSPAFAAQPLISAVRAQTEKNFAALTVLSQEHGENCSNLENSVLNQVAAENVEIKAELIEVAL